MEMGLKTNPNCDGDMTFTLYTRWHTKNVLSLSKHQEICNGAKYTIAEKLSIQ